MSNENLNWETLSATISTMDENTVRAHLNYENSTYKRKSYLIRLHQRYAKLRDARERKEVIEGALL